MLYSPPDSLCASSHSPCSYVQSYGNLSLEKSESVLNTLFRRVELEVKNDALTRNCSNLFSLFYCHQVYTQCSVVLNSSTSLVYEAKDAHSVCESDCFNVMFECEFDWLFLTDLVDSLAVPDLPPLLSNCSTDDDSVEEVCSPLIAGTYMTLYVCECE